MNRILLVAALAIFATSAPAAELACEGPFAADSSAARLVETFGRDNVVTGEVPGPEGTTMIATTIYPNDPARTMQVRWWDEEKVEYLAGVTLAEGDSGPGGVKVGMPIEQVQAINGAPFRLFGFYWDYGGFAGFESGVLSNLPGGCVLNLRFAPTREDLSEAVTNAISGDTELPSDMVEVLEAKVAVREVNLGYVYPEALGEGGEDAAAE